MTLDAPQELGLVLTGAARTLQCSLPPSVVRRATLAEQQVLIDAVVMICQSLHAELSWELPREAVIGFGEETSRVTDRLSLIADQLDRSASYVVGSLDWVWSLDQVSVAMMELTHLGGVHEVQVLGALVGVMADALLEAGVDLWVQRNVAAQAVGRLGAREALDDLFALMA